jgi:protein-tyrosine phosphatase
MRRVGEYPLWIGTAREARDIKQVLDAEIEVVVDLAMEEPPILPTRELVYLRFPLLDGEGNPPWLLRSAVAAVGQLIAARVPTLVACSGGMSRSPCVVAAALAVVEARSMAAVLASVPRPLDVSPRFHHDLASCLELPPDS